MATHRISIFDLSTIPDASGKVWFEPYSILATNDVWKQLIIRFDQDGLNNAQISTRVGIYGSFVVPQNYVGTAKILPLWTSTVTSGNCVFDFDYRAVGGDDAESLDQTGTQESVSVTDAAPTAAHRLLRPSMTLTASNLAAGDVVLYYFVVDGTDAADTLAGARILFDVKFEYSDT